MVVIAQDIFMAACEVRTFPREHPQPLLFTNSREFHDKMLTLLPIIPFRIISYQVVIAIISNSF